MPLQFTDGNLSGYLQSIESYLTMVSIAEEKALGENPAPDAKFIRVKDRNRLIAAAAVYIRSAREKIEQVDKIPTL